MRAYFTDHGVPKCYNNLLKEDIDDSETFFKMGFSKIEGIIFDKEIAEGKKIKLRKNLEEYFDKYAKNEPVQYIGNSMLFEEQTLLMHSITLSGKNKSVIVEKSSEQEEQPKMMHSKTYKGKNQKVSFEKTMTETNSQEN